MTMTSQPVVQHLQQRAGDAKEYHLRVRHKVYLWGSAGVTADVTFTPAPLLHIWNDTFGERITVGTRQASGAEHKLGTLEPGEHFTVELHHISGVFAECRFGSRVACAIQRD
jgi:hypothetical protein